MKPCKCFKLTDKDWYPPWRLDQEDGRFDTVNLVQVSLIEFPLDRGGGWRVAVWGADDTGMEKDFLPPKNTTKLRHEEQKRREYQDHGMTYMQALATFLEVCAQEKVNRVWLEKERFVSA